MSKTKKIATAVVSLVLAATMVTSLAGCVDNTKDPNDGGGGTTGSSHTLRRSQDLLTPSTDKDGNLTYAEGTAVSLNMGQNSNYTISFRENKIATGASVTLPDGKTYRQGDMKPAWATMEDELNIKITDSFTALSSSQQITQAVTDKLLGTYTMISGNSTSIVNEGSGNNSFLDLSLYLDYMPHFKKFLEDNPVVYMSLTSATETGAIYYAPYFDGNDDIEKYELANQHWVVALLDNDDAGDDTTFAAQAQAKASTDDTKRFNAIDGTKASVESFMGTTGEWWVETTASEEDTSEIVRVTVSYDDALAAAQQSGSALNTALTAAGVTTSSLTSGNIVDLQNAAINATSGAVTGAQLLDILRAYIDVAYQDENGDSFYETRSDVFNGYNAAWDVDLLVALSRCIVTNRVSLNDNDKITDGWLYAISARQGNSQRQNDLTSLAGELYGVRGLTSRYLNTYIDSEGELHDARTGTEMWEALDNLHDMVEEGLLYTGTQNASGSTSYYKEGDPVVFMIYDYVQTQTANGGFALQGLNDSVAAVLPEGYNFAPISTPVSKWNDGNTSTAANADGISYDYDGDYKYMRFTESWRSVKNTGFGIPYENVANDPDRLSAALSIIDYMFSNDGQIVMTYGQMSTTNTGVVDEDNNSVTAKDNGWWYGNAVPETEVDPTDYWRYADIVDGEYYIKDEWADKYFFFDNELYTGTLYKGEQVPIMTTGNLYFYYGYTVNDSTLASGALEAWGYARSYTNYARGVIGSAQPMGNKLQSFEYQGTPEIGIEGANKVAASLVNGTISHVYLQLDNDKGNTWYTIVPTTLPYDSNTANHISTTYALLTDTVFSGDSGATTNFSNDIVWYGLGGNATLTYGSTTMQVPADAAAAVAALDSNFGMSTYESLMKAAWEDMQDFYYEWIELTRIYAETTTAE